MTDTNPKPSRKVELAARTVLDLKPRELKDLARIIAHTDARCAEYLRSDLEVCIAESPTYEDAALGERAS